MEMSLSVLLTKVKPTHTAKRVMAVTLARCILHLFEGPWLQDCMSVNDIYVYCRIENDQPHPIFDKVFVATRFGKSRNKGGTTPRTYKIHPFPSILALGIILIELELGEHLPDIKKDPYSHPRRVNHSTSRGIFSSNFKNTSLWIPVSIARSNFALIACLSRVSTRSIQVSFF